MAVGGQLNSSAALTPGKGHGTCYTGGWVGPTDGLNGCGKSRLPTGIRSPDRLPRSYPLYRLRYPGPYVLQYRSIFTNSVCTSGK
jgi:hypothetical protein